MYYLINKKSKEIILCSDKENECGENEKWIESNELFVSPKTDGKKIIEGETLENINQMKLTALRKKRDEMLVNTIWIMQRHNGELEGIKYNLSSETTLTEDEYKEWLVYWKDLRDLPENYDIDNATIDAIEQYQGFPTMPSSIMKG